MDPERCPNRRRMHDTGRPVCVRRDTGLPVSTANRNDGVVAWPAAMMTTEATTKFLHAADLHLGAPLESLSARLDGATAERIRELARQALDRLVDAAIERGVEFVVLAGDVYDHADRELGAQLRFQRSLERLDAASIRVFIAHGNHDPVVTGYRPARALPPNVTVFPTGEVTASIVDARNGSSIRVAGVSFGTRHEQANLAARFVAIGRQPGTTVGVLHANVAGNRGHDPYSPCDVSDLAAAPVDYWALGHVHTRSVHPLGAGRWWAYPGNLQGRSTKPAECGPKGSLVVSIEQGQVQAPTFVACDAVRFERIDVDVSACGDLGAVIDAVNVHVSGRLSEEGVRTSVIRARLVGCSSVHAGLHEHRDRLLQFVRDDAGGSWGESLLVGVEVATRPPIDRRELLARRDITAAALAELDRLRPPPKGSDVDGLQALLAGLDPTARQLVQQAIEREPGLRDRLADQIERTLLDVLDVGDEHGPASRSA